MKKHLFKLTLLITFSFTSGLNAQWDQRPTTTFETDYEEGFATWDETKFYNQWETLLPDAFTGFNPNEGGYLQFEWSDKRIIKAVNIYDTPYRITTEMMNAGPWFSGGIVLRVPPISGHDEDPQEPAGNGIGYNRTGIAILPNDAGDGMYVQFSAAPAPQLDPIDAIRIDVPLPLGQPNLTKPDPVKFKLTVEDCGSSVYVFLNDEPFFRVDLNTLSAGVYSGGTIIAPDETTIGSFTGMHVVERGKIAFAQRAENLRLYDVKIETNKNLTQSITFDAISKKLTTDTPFELTATASSGLPVEFSVVSGPATLSGNTVTLTGVYGIVRIAANQSGDATYPAANQVVNQFYVEDPSLGNGNISPAYQDNVDNWVVTDALGRELPTYEDVSAKRSDKYVGVFYYVWHGFHGSKVNDMTDIIANYPSDPLSSSNDAWGKEGEFHFWGEPEAGYFRAEDPWVIRRDLQMLSNANVDFLYLDLSNGYIYPKAVQALFEVSLEMRLEGIRSPQIMFLTHASAAGQESAVLINELYDLIYSDQLYEDLWFMWEGKPLILGDPNDPILRPEVKSFFTIKYSWAWTNPFTRNQWQWLDLHPQDYAWSSDRSVADQIPVGVASHPNNSIGTSYSGGSQPTVNADYRTNVTGQGAHFNEQWIRALQVDPSVIMVTQWNEWLAQRFIWDQGSATFAGRPTKNGDSHFVDAFGEEFNRDMAPMKDGHTDNFYYQLISNIRKFKGMAAPESFSGEKTIAINGSFDDWIDVTPRFIDPTGDVMHRNFAGYDPTVTLTNTTGRNDIVESRVTYDNDNIYFYAKTANSITSNAGQNWMLLFIDIDKDKNTGWEGYDWMINKSPMSSTTSLQKHNGSSWDAASNISYYVTGNEIEIAIPLGSLNLSQGAIPQLHFKWADNPQSLNDITAFFTDGETAPDRRFNYNFDGRSTLGVDDNELNLEGLKVYPNPVKDIINLSATKEINDMAVYDLVGQQVLKSTVNSNDLSVDISGLQAGIYIVKVTISESVKRFRIVKE